MTPIAALPVRLFYVDDSGSPDTGWIVYSWIECTIADWRLGLRAWLDLRKQMYADHKIPPSYELHAAHFVGGHGNPSTDPSWNLRKRNRATAMQQALAAIGAAEALRVGTVHRTGDRGRAYGRQRGQVYEALVAHLDDRCARAGEYGMIFMEGDGSEHAYYAAHRGLKLADRHIIEDPLFQGSRWRSDLRAPKKQTRLSTCVGQVRPNRLAPAGRSADDVFAEEAVPGQGEEDGRVDQGGDDPLHDVVGLDRAGQ
jgi:hypothetical protein